MAQQMRVDPKTITRDEAGHVVGEKGYDMFSSGRIFLLFIEKALGGWKQVALYVAFPCMCQCILGNALNPEGT
jgi:hypothetical protein